MWEINNNFQLFSFGISLAAGFCYCVLYDILRALRKSRPISDLTVFLQDVIYFAFIGIVTFLILMVLANGEIRGFVIFGITVGFCGCFLTLSKFLLKILTMIFEFFGTVNHRFCDFLNVEIEKITAFLIKIIKKVTVLLNIIKKYLKIS